MAIDRFPVEEGAILAFARAIGDPNPIYRDREYAAATKTGAMIAPPTFVQAGAQFDPDYPLRPKLGERWFGPGKAPTGREAAGTETGAGRGLHAEQHFRYHRPLRCGDVLSAVTRSGRRWEKDGRSGKLVFSETITEYRDEHGDLVVTARSIGVLTERPAAPQERLA